MRTKTTEDRQLLELLDPVAEAEGLEIVRLRLMGGNTRRLQIMAERPSDHEISIEECTRLSRAVSAVLDAAGPVAEGMEVVALVRPTVLLAMGGTAAEWLLGVKRSLGDLRNQVHRYAGIPLVVTYHPAALLRNPNWKKPTWDDVRIARQLLER